MLVIVKLIVIAICAFIQLNIYGIDYSNTAVLLLTLILSSIPMIIRPNILENKSSRILLNVLHSTYLLGSLFLPAMRCYIPLFVMDIIGYRLIISALFLCPVIILILQEGYGVPLLLISALASLLHSLVMHNEALTNELKQLRDNSKEHELLVEEKNRRLMEKQDSEIYTATLKERNRIAREIHDNVGHMLTRSILQVGAIKTINKNDVLDGPLTDLHNTLNTAMSNIRNSVHDLHDESLDMKSAIKEILDKVENVQFNFDYDMDNHVPRNIKYCFISITKEAINNMIKHSNATHMTVLVQEHPGFYQLLLHDNGSDISINTGDGIGLTNMKDRVKSLNGNIKISSDDGFKILVTITKQLS